MAFWLKTYKGELLNLSTYERVYATKPGPNEAVWRVLASVGRAHDIIAEVDTEAEAQALVDGIGGELEAKMLRDFAPK